MLEITISDPDSELQQQGTNKGRNRNYVERAVRKPNEIALTSHLDTELNGLAMHDNDYGNGNLLKNARKKGQNSHDKIPF